MIEQKPIVRDPRTKFTLENCIKMIAHPKGVLGFMKGMNKELNLGPTQSYINTRVGTFVDITKYVIYASPIASMIYNMYK